jgi:hypothetical protein
MNITKSENNNTIIMIIRQGKTKTEKQINKDLRCGFGTN